MLKLLPMVTKQGIQDTELQRNGSQDFSRVSVHKEYRNDKIDKERIPELLLWISGYLS